MRAKVVIIFSGMMFLLFNAASLSSSTLIHVDDLAITQLLFKMGYLPTYNDNENKIFKNKDNSLSLSYTGTDNGLLMFELYRSFYFGRDIPKEYVESSACHITAPFVKLIANDAGYTLKSDFLCNDIGDLSLILPVVEKNMEDFRKDFKRKATSFKRDSVVSVGFVEYDLKTHGDQVLVNFDCEMSANIEAEYVVGFKIYFDNCLYVKDDYTYTFSDYLLLSNKKVRVQLPEIVTDLFTTCRIEIWVGDDFVFGRKNIVFNKK